MGWPEEDCLWTYTLLTEPLLSSELARLSGSQTLGDTDFVSFQPCPNPEQLSQDRFVIQDWSLPSGTWAFRAVFDGILCYSSHEIHSISVEHFQDTRVMKLRITLQTHYPRWCRNL